MNDILTWVNVGHHDDAIAWLSEKVRAAIASSKNSYHLTQHHFDGESLETWLARRNILARGQKNGNGSGTPLVMAVLFATPTARDFRSGSVSQETLARNSRPLNEQVLTQWPAIHGVQGTNGPSGCELGHAAGQLDQAHSSTPGKPVGSLNSAWVAQLMGYPANWCETPGDRTS